MVEDDALNALFLGQMLEEMGHVVCAMEATEAGAVAAAAQFRPDLMIVDAQLRDGSGVIAVERILENGFIPHVFVSGGRVRATRSDAVILHKPFREVDLAQAIQRARADAAL
ncbi:response regulator [Methylocella silvestris]|uniref:response regulator n=1 Tax=Methylocella silvestris TaxID=199596 RepID=UPI001FDF2E92|nr:response regulator [Methylocella silvestris]